MDGRSSTTLEDTLAVDRLRSTVRGDVHVPGTRGYDAAAGAWNLAARQHPAVIVMAERTADVIAAVQFARDADMGVGVMATGHGVGTPADGGLLVNTSRMREVRVDAETGTVRVQAGASWRDVIPLARAHGLAGLAGSAPHVGVVGYTMGGGFGWLGRKYGLNSSSVTAADVVTADGALRRASDDEHADLCWGLKGGGGNFGIVTSLQFRLYPLTAVYGGAVYHPIERGPEVLARYASWSAELPDEMTTAVAFMNIPPLASVPGPLRGRSVVMVKGCYCGTRLEDGEALFRAVRAGLGRPIADTFGPLSVAELDKISRDPVAPLGVIQYAGMLADLSPEVINALVDAAGAGSGSPLLLVEIRQLGGALARRDDELHPMGAGDAAFSLNALGLSATPEHAEGARRQIARLADATRRHQTGAVFVNFMEFDPAQERVGSAYPPEDWQRLVALKDKYDPGNLFRFNRNIPPADLGRRRPG